MSPLLQIALPPRGASWVPWVGGEEEEEGMHLWGLGLWNSRVAKHVTSSNMTYLKHLRIFRLQR